MKSMKKRIIALILCFAMLIPSLCVGVFAYEVPNDLKGHWAEKEVYTLITEDIIAGYNDGSFKPNNSITRAEFCKLVIDTLVKYEVISYSNKTNTFADVPASEWFSKYVETAYEYDIVSGVGDNKFEPKNPVTREQMSKILVNVYCQLFDISFSEISNPAITSLTFRDYNKISSWALPYVSGAYNVGLMQGSDGNFNPAKPTTRAEAATAIFRLFDFSYVGLLRLDDFVYRFNNSLADTGYEGYIADYKWDSEAGKYYFISDEGTVHFDIINTVLPESTFSFNISFDTVSMNGQEYIDNISIFYVPRQNYEKAYTNYANLYSYFIISALPFMSSDIAVQVFNDIGIYDSFGYYGFNRIGENTMTFSDENINFSCKLKYISDQYDPNYESQPYGVNMFIIDFGLK